MCGIIWEKLQVITENKIPRTYSDVLRRVCENNEPLLTDAIREICHGHSLLNDHDGRMVKSVVGAFKCDVNCID